MALSAAELEQALAKPAPEIKGLTEAELAAARGDDGTPGAPAPDEGGVGSVDDLPAAGNKGDAPAGAAEEGAAPPPSKARENFVPQSRVNEIVERARARTELLQNQVKELQAAVAKGEEDLNFAEVEKEIDNLEGQYSDLLLRGKAEEAAALRRSIRTIERRLVNTQAAYHAENRSTRAIEELRTDGVIDELEAAYAFLDPQDPSYEKEIVDEILAYQKGFVASGHRSDIAMAMAANYVVSQLELEPEGGEPEAAPEGESEAPADAGGLRQGNALAAKAALAARLPPGARGGRPGAPVSTTAKDLASLGQVGFDRIRGKLSEADLAKARGDDI